MNSLLLRAETVFLRMTLFCLPWGTRYFFVAGELAGQSYEYLSLFVSVLDICALVTVGLAVRNGVWRKIERQRPEVVLMLLLFFTSACVSLLSAREVWPAMAWITRVCLAIALGYIIRQRSDKLSLLVYFLGSLFLSSFWGIWQFASQNAVANKYLGLAAHPVAEAGTSVVEAEGRWLRAYGSAPHPNVFGGMMLMGGLLTIYLASRATTLRQRLSFLLLWPFFAIALLLSFSRSAWLGMFLSALVCLFFSWWGRGAANYFRRIFYAHIFAFSFFALLFWPLVSTRLTGESRLEKRSLLERRELLSERKDWTGTGWGFANYGIKVFVTDPRPGHYYQPVHNFFYMAFLEAGLLSIPLILILLSVFVKKCRKQASFWLIFLPLTPLFFLDHWLWTLYFSPYLLVVYYSLPSHSSEQIGNMI